MALCSDMVSDMKACVAGGQSEVRDGEEALGFGLVAKTVVAKQWHFAYTMPVKIRVFRNSIDPQNSSVCKEIEAPNALLRTFRSCINRRKLVDVTTVLFASPNEGSGPLFMETEI